MFFFYLQKRQEHRHQRHHWAALSLDQRLIWWRSWWRCGADGADAPAATGSQWGNGLRNDTASGAFLGEATGPV